MKNLIVVFGGVSVEHDVSVITGVLTLNCIDRILYNPIPVFVDKNGLWFTGESLFDIDNYKNLDYKKLSPVTFDMGSNILYRVKGKSKNKKLVNPIPIAVAVNCMHGFGEGGSLAGLLKNCNIPLASPDVLPSAVCMDKGATKLFLKGLNIPSVKYLLTDGKVKTEKIKKLRFPLIVKPNSAGSSVGIGIAKNKEELFSKMAFASRFDDKVIIEEMLTDFIEINCACYKNSNGETVVSECEKPITKNAILSFEDKYVEGDREFPAKIEKSISDKVKKLTKKIYENLNCSGVIRIDFFIVDGEVLVNEINCVPGSLAYYLFSDTLKGFTQILNQVIRLAEINYSKESSLERNLTTNLLQINGSKGGKGKKVDKMI